MPSWMPLSRSRRRTRASSALLAAFSCRTSKGQEDVYDASGNKIDVKANVALPAKEIKKLIKDVEKKLKDGKKKGTLSEEETWELEDKLNDLKEKLESAK